ncbi:MAG: exodeoxyribonuclease VII large subunit [Alphaproteobacteria bacterium]|nr:exodeoxyribonuclease VII large subunit [Alphaproteobacteria bacterium]
MPKNATPSLIDQPRPGSNLPKFTVSELSGQLKRTVEDRFGQIRVRGEISECKFHSNGHVYLTLKEDKAILAGVIWHGATGRAGMRPEVGMEVICTGRLTIYAGQSKYQLVVEQMALAGEGALLKLIEDRKKKLAAEGLFDEDRKKPLPSLPRVIGVVTSPTGAVIRDILHRLRNRFPCHVIVWPVAVQGEGAAAQIAAGIEGFNRLGANDGAARPDLLIVARGGGSIEDLMPFNEEIVVRAAAASKIPLISAVGHETDTTLIDFASDVRAPTPTAAAEMAVPVRADLIDALENAGARLRGALKRELQGRTERLAALARTLGDPRRMLEPLLQRLDDRGERLAAAVRGTMQARADTLARIAAKLRHPREILAQAETRLAADARAMGLAMRRVYEQREALLARTAPLLESLSPKKVLQRGYTLVRDGAGHAITAAAMAQSGSAVDIIFHDGERKAVIDGEAGSKKQKQGKLFD